MRARGLAPLIVAGSVALLFMPSAEAKLRITVAIDPARPAAGKPAALTMRTYTDLVRRHGIRLFAVGPWRAQTGQGFFEIRLRRIGPRVLRASVRFPYPGRWHLNVPPSAASSQVDWWVTVGPRA